MSIKVKVKVLKGFLEKLRGLEFRESDDCNYMFENCKCIHTFGMKKPIDVAFVGADCSVLEVSRNVGARRVLKNRNAQFTVERFSSQKPWLEVGTKCKFEEER